ncbi:DNA polymerase III subunit alpha [Thiohalophilus thiocyanatoxydans]|uniref:DNA polymerase III subunit alpha n=1 Tax=Thiohalophilus thiocyanatoxydans TaxID=381308 RepID=A0A4R8IHQ4_9GAMM|nr:DNA polymerase III subunit alpha [Thiohalophilus thiocyanatoxydans]TDY00131.1 DNA polymerase III alpha subunit [Thiohalophilus thiocyanatoxydans]
MDSFVHLHLHTEYSLANGLVRIKPLVKAVADAGMPAVAMTDQCNLFGMVKFYKAAIAAGVKPIIGVDAWLHNEEDPNQPGRLVLLCQDNTGYRNLTRLVSRSYIEGQHRGQPTLSREWLEGATDGLIALSGAREGDVGQALLNGNPQLAARRLEQWQRLFPERYYLEVQRTGREGEEDYLHAVVELAIAHDLPVVATNDVHFLARDNFEAHEARVCINEGRTLDDPRRPKRFSEQQYLRTPQEMAELFEDLPEALANTVEIAKRCNVELTLDKNYLPDFPVPAGMTIDEFLREESRKGLEARLNKFFDTTAADYESIRREYHERLEMELDVIIAMGFPGYFLIVADFIRWAKENGVPVGPGRGSGAGSLVAYALTITDLDPIKYDLLFERFLNPERVSMPDFDVDFCMEGRDRVIDYVADYYGREKVSQIITYGTMAAKAVVRDVGRVLGHPYGFVDRIAKLIPFEVGMTLEKALEQEEQLQELYDQDEEVRGLIDLARMLEGCARNAGKHAGGVVIAPSQLTDFTPLYCEQGSGSIVTQFDKDDVEAVGLVKFDFLGLRTLTIIDWAVRAINQDKAAKGEAPVDIISIPLDDEKTFELLKANQTTAVFQLESRGMKDLIKRLQPDSFEEIIALVALFRPGPLQSGMVDDFINVKHRRKQPEYPHPDIVAILEPTYGVILYQEQVMQIAQVLAGYTLGGADLLRRAMGKKKPEEMAKQRDIFTKGALERGVEEKTATYIFDLMEKFAGYGFNKSHSAAYALVSYQTAWLKAHYPAPFMAAVLSADMDNTDKVVTLIDECSDMQLTVLPPDINQCEYRFTAQDEQTVVYGLGAIKGVGGAAIDSMIEERNANGSFADLFDFTRRIDTRKVNRRTLEALIMAGALDVFGENRATLMASLPAALKTAEQHSRDQAVGMQDLFGIGMAPESNSGPVAYHRQPEWSEDERLAAEKQTLGLYLTGHPIERYLPELAGFVSARIVDLKPTRDQTVVVAGLIVAMRTMNTRRGDRMAFITIDDRSARIELAVFSEPFQRYRDLLAKDKLIVVEGEVSIDEYSGGYKMSARSIYDINQARENFARKLLLSVDHHKAGNGFIPDLQHTLTPFREGFCPVIIDYHRDDARAQIALGETWRVHPTDELLHRLRDSLGDDHVKVIY